MIRGSSYQDQDQLDPVVPVIPAAQVDPLVLAAQLSSGPAVQASVSHLQYRKLKAFWTFISKGSFFVLWLCLSDHIILGCTVLVVFSHPFVSLPDSLQPRSKRFCTANHI